MVGLYAVAVHIFDRFLGQNFRQVLDKAENYAITNINAMLLLSHQLVEYEFSAPRRETLFLK